MCKVQVHDLDVCAFNGQCACPSRTMDLWYSSGRVVDAFAACSWLMGVLGACMCVCVCVCVCVT